MLFLAMFGERFGHQLIKIRKLFLHRRKQFPNLLFRLHIEFFAHFLKHCCGHFLELQFQHFLILGYVFFFFTHPLFQHFACRLFPVDALPRLKQLWTHLSRYQAGIGTRGPGETQLEEDRRLVANRIRDLKEKLEVVKSRKEREVRTRAEEHTVSLVGYTNAGKSRLMNCLTHSDVFVKNQLFSTLDTRTRQWHIKDFGKILLSDTVGFIRELPHHLVASFKATLEEARQARLLLHVVDASNPHLAEQIAAVNSVLKELECDKKPTLLVFNKIDRIADRADINLLLAQYPKAVGISCVTREGIDQLTEAVVEALTADFVEAEVTADAANGKVQAYLAAHAEVYRQEYRDGQVILRCRLPRYLVRHVLAEGGELRMIAGVELMSSGTEQSPESL